jgi:uncharacterized protein YdcH (DUF465 family)
MEEKVELQSYAGRQSEEYRRLEQEHRELDRQIEEKFGGKKYLTAEEEVEKKTLQKQKLAKKDRMQHLLAEPKTQ